MKKVWLITGCSAGFGRELAKIAIANGYLVAVTARNEKDVVDIVNGNEDNATAYSLDVTNEIQIKSVIEAVVEKYGRIDVLVNNAGGAGLFTSVEEIPEDELKYIMNVNFYGLLSMIQHVLPHMRKQRSGHILNVASIGGLVAYPGVGAYNAAKFAVFGLSEALQQEVLPLGIRVTVVAPSGFRTGINGTPLMVKEGMDKNIPAIADYDTSVGIVRKNLMTSFGKQPGDPVSGALAMLKAVEDSESPFRLFLGKAAVQQAEKRSQEILIDAKAYWEISENCDYPDSSEENLFA